MAVQVRVNGKGPYRFVFDTGAPVVLLSTKVGKEAGLIKDGNGFLSLGMLSTLGPVEVASIEIGTVKAKEVPAIVMDHPTVQLMAKILGPVEGIIGFPFFARYKMTIDYQAKEISFAPSAYKPPDPIKAIMETVTAITQDHDSSRPIATSGQWGIVLSKDSDSKAPGVTIHRVLTGGAAAEAGLRDGDRLLSIDGRWTDSAEDAYVAAAHVRPQKSARVVIVRGHQQHEFTITPRSGL
jgi:membrane-associated protease RseP (regulator of RpoE activity)